MIYSTQITCKTLVINSPSTAYALKNQIKRPKALIQLLKGVIPCAYIFSAQLAANQLDLLIVMDKHDYQLFNQIYSILDFALLGHPHINCTAYTYATIYEMLSRGHIYFSSLCQPKTCVFQLESHFELPTLTADKARDIVKTATSQFQNHLKPATGFFRAARQSFEDGNVNLACFMLQQACELSLRSLLLSLRGKQLRCHELTVLRKHLKHFAPSISGCIHENEEIEITTLERLQEAYINARYEQNYHVSGQEYHIFESATIQILNRVRDIFNMHCKIIISEMDD